ncbi:MAG TPA: hypothetical protein VFM33_05685 [Aquabacterium sp.]|nr:hypothetical protein [Aquabacterium sp.]
MKSIFKSFALPLALTALCHSAWAYEFNTLNTLSQAEFRLLGEDLSSALSYKAVTPAADLGLTGFDVGLSAGATHLENRDVIKKAAGGASVPTVLPTVAIRAQKGLPFNLNLGASYTSVPGTPLAAFGGELRWAFLPGTTLMPAVAARLSMSQTSGLSQLKMHSTGYDISISKGFTLLTPYAGIGHVDSRVSAPESPALSSERIGQTKYFGGANMNLGLMNLDFEADRTGKATSYNLKLGLRF